MKTIEQKLQDSKNYISKSAQHLFVVNDKTFLKVIPFEQDGYKFVGRLIVKGDHVELMTRSLTSAMKWDLQDYLFPKYVKTKSIPYFKKMRELVAMIEKEINAVDNKVLIGKIKERLKELEIVKE